MTPFCSHPWEKNSHYDHCPPLISHSTFCTFLYFHIVNLHSPFLGEKIRKRSSTSLSNNIHLPFTRKSVKHLEALSWKFADLRIVLQRNVISITFISSFLLFSNNFLSGVSVSHSCLLFWIKEDNKDNCF